MQIEIEAPFVDADLTVVEVEHPLEITQLEREQGGVPPDVVPERITVLPDAEVLIEPLRTLTVTALHLEDMSHGMDGPKIISIETNGSSAKLLRSRVIAAFFQSESEHTHRKTVTRCALIYCADYSGRHVAQPRSVALPKTHEVVKAQGQSKVSFETNQHQKKAMKFKRSDKVSKNLGSVI